MFTVGIFTTHFPYIAMLAFYAYFLIFGVTQSSKENVPVSEKSFITQPSSTFNTGSFVANNTNCFVAPIKGEILSDLYKNSESNQQWKPFYGDDFYLREFYKNSLLGRPPPYSFRYPTISPSFVNWMQLICTS